MRSSSRGRPTVMCPITKKGLGFRHVIYCPENRLYVDRGCSGYTKHRFDAWAGNGAQATRARQVYPDLITSQFHVYIDGEEVHDE